MPTPWQIILVIMALCPLVVVIEAAKHLSQLRKQVDRLEVKLDAQRQLTAELLGGLGMPGFPEDEPKVYDLVLSSLREQSHEAPQSKF